MLIARINGRTINIPPKPRPVTPTIPPWLPGPRPQRYSLIFAFALPKTCRLCGAAIASGQRFCQARCRIEASGREDIVQKTDAQRGWNYVATTTRRTQ